MNMPDKLDRITILIITVVVVLLGAMSMDYQATADNNSGHGSVGRAYALSMHEIPSERMKTLRDLIALNNIQKAEVIVKELLENYPYEAELYMLTGDIMMRKQDPVKALYAYKKAVDLNPDYTDKKTPLFQGRKIKVAVEEAEEIIHNSLSQSPEDGDMKKAKKTMYYLLRRLAGSCG